MKIWMNLPKEKRLRIWLSILSLHKAYIQMENYIVLGFEKGDNFYGIILFNYALTIYFKIRIDERRLVIWNNEEIEPFGIKIRD